MSRACTRACKRYGVCDCDQPAFVVRPIVLWHRDPPGARQHPLTDDERQNRDAALEFGVTVATIALGLLGLWASAGG